MKINQGERQFHNLSPGAKLPSYASVSRGLPSPLKPLMHIPPISTKICKPSKSAKFAKFPLISLNLRFPLIYVLFASSYFDHNQRRRPGAEFGGTEIFFAWPKISEWRFLGKKFPFSRQKFLMTYFLVIDQILQIFPCFSQIFPIFAMLNVIFDPFLTRKTPFFHSVDTFTRIRQHY